MNNNSSRNQKHSFQPETHWKAGAHSAIHRSTLVYP
nr:MAG TPA: hypothetical protein [Caudoviricetes sp.]